MRTGFEYIPACLALLLIVLVAWAWFQPRDRTWETFDTTCHLRGGVTVRGFDEFKGETPVCVKELVP